MSRFARGKCSRQSPLPWEIPLGYFHHVTVPASSSQEGTSDAASSRGDAWYEWLTRRRYGGDAQFEQSVRRTVERYRDRVLDGAQLKAGMTLLDVGTGEGLVAFGASERVGPSLKLICTDTSAALLQRAEDAARKRGLRDACTFVVAPAERLEGVGDACADVVTTRAVLVYVADKSAAAREFYRVLKPGGRVSLAEPVYRDEALRLEALAKYVASQPADGNNLDARLFLRWKGAQLPSNAAAIAANPLTNFTERDLVGILEKAGFADIHLEFHLDTRKGDPVPWDTFLDTAHHPQAPTLREILANHFTEAERRHFESGLRPVVESGQMVYRDGIAFLTANKPADGNPRA